MREFHYGTYQFNTVKIHVERIHKDSVTDKGLEMILQPNPLLIRNVRGILNHVKFPHEPYLHDIQYGGSNVKHIKQCV